MKVPTDRYEMLKGAIQKIAPQIPAHAESVAQSGKAKHLPTRIRWDAAYASKYDLGLIYDDGCNDSHIDTALRQIMREIGLPQFADKN